MNRRKFLANSITAISALAIGGLSGLRFLKPPVKVPQFNAEGTRAGRFSCAHPNPCSIPRIESYTEVDAVTIKLNYRKCDEKCVVSAIKKDLEDFLK